MATAWAMAADTGRIPTQDNAGGFQQTAVEGKNDQARRNAGLIICIAEDKGFEPSHRFTGLAHFECAPLNRLGNPPFPKNRITAAISCEPV